MLIKLESQGRRIEEIDSMQLPEKLVIGRSKQCDWIMPMECSMISRKHACIIRKDQAVYIHDLESKHGIYYKNERIATRELKPGDRIMIGECTLLVQKTASDKMRRGRPAQLIGLTGEMRNQRFPITSPEMTIGSETDSNLVIDDPLVSQKHAKIKTDPANSGFSIMDLESRNGTAINNRKLEPFQEEHLRKGQIVYIVHYGFQLDTGRGLPPGKAPLILAISCSLLLLISLAFFKMQIKPVNQTIENALLLAADGAYKRSLEIASQGNAKHPDIASITANVDKWCDVMDAINTKNWSKVRKHLEEIDVSERPMWENNEAGRHFKELVQEARDVLSCYNKAKSLIESGSTNKPAEISDAYEEIDQIINKYDGGMPPHLVSLLTEISAVRGKMAQTLKIKTIEHCWNFIQHIQEATGSDEAECKIVEAWRNQTALDQVLSGDSLKERKVSSQRSQPVGQYDRYLGIENFYSFFKDLAGQKQLRPLRTEEFKPLIEDAAVLYGEVSQFMRFVNRQKDKAWIAGSLETQIRKYRGYMRQRDELLAGLKTHYEKNDDLKALIAAGIALRLCDDPAALRIERQRETFSLKDWAIDQFMRHQAQLKAPVKR